MYTYKYKDLALVLYEALIPALFLRRIGTGYTRQRAGKTGNIDEIYESMGAFTALEHDWGAGKMNSKY